jgi:NAD(P)-dependent dehydrogenase (short-subunit alcohol dehydrogenase family)
MAKKRSAEAERMGRQLLEGKVAVITGAGAGIGLAIARRFAAEGASIVLSGRNEARGRAAEHALRDGNTRAVYVPLDVSREEEVQRVMERAVAEFGALDILINNAGPNGDDFGIGAVHDLPTETFDRTMKVGAYGPFWCCKYALPKMIAVGGGTMVHISAVAAVRALPRFAGYALAKSVLEALSRQVANDYASSGIRSNTLLVGTVRPDEYDISTLPPDFDSDTLDQAIGRTTMLGRVGRYTDVAEATLFLASSLSQYITGASLPVDGGALGKMQYPDYVDAMA